ncbi:protein of unknown function [Shinella sp. WSC3-e]|nr:hypothetical protein SHINE37_41818 [Rhizobiaceae bacterium]CAK7256431.1 protein of unknown function [Shinella sp. WSC3-e]
MQALPRFCGWTWTRFYAEPFVPPYVCLLKETIGEKVRLSNAINAWLIFFANH